MQRNSSVRERGLYFVSYNRTRVMHGPFETYEEAEQQAAQDLVGSRGGRGLVLKAMSEVSYPDPPPLVVEKY